MAMEYRKVYKHIAPEVLKGSRVTTASDMYIHSGDSVRTGIIKWSKHGIINLLTPGHDPPVDITIYVDICRNPGPVHSGLESNISQGQSQNCGTFIQTAVVDKITYNRSKLLDIRRQCITRANHHLLSTLKDLGLLRYRGSRGGKRKISVIISPRGRESRSAWGHTTGTVNWNNLVSIKCHPENSNKTSSHLPHVLLSNIRPLVPKFDELSTFLMLNKADIVAISESWLNEQIDSLFVTITGYDLYCLNRLSGRVGGVCAFVSENIPCKRLLDLENANYECMWLWLRHYRLPRPLCGILIAVLYCPPETCADKQREFVHYLSETIDSVPDCGIIVLGDYNNLD
ncbi:Hypothetical predicted protein, partial [Paramuricea clavata]